MKKKVLVTGGAGFIGSHLVESLVRAHCHVIVVDTALHGNKIPKNILHSIDFHQADANNEDLLMKLSKDVHTIFHFAAHLGVDIVSSAPQAAQSNEYESMHNIVTVCKVNMIPNLIYASTSSVYGTLNTHKAVTEMDDVRIHNPYAEAKRNAERHFLKAFMRGVFLKATMLRYFNVYGPRQDTRMVIPRMYYNAKRNLPIEIFGDGTQTRDFTYIEDAINATLSVFFTSTPGFEVYNVANGEEHSINDVANMMLHATHSDSAIKHIPNPPNRADYEVSRRWGCSDKLFAHTGFKPNTKLEDGLRKFVESFN